MDKGTDKWKKKKKNRPEKKLSWVCSFKNLVGLPKKDNKWTIILMAEDMDRQTDGQLQREKKTWLDVGEQGPGGSGVGGWREMWPCNVQMDQRTDWKVAYGFA